MTKRNLQPSFPPLFLHQPLSPAKNWCLRRVLHIRVTHLHRQLIPLTMSDDSTTIDYAPHHPPTLDKRRKAFDDRRAMASSKSGARSRKKGSGSGSVSSSTSSSSSSHPVNEVAVNAKCYPCYVVDNKFIPRVSIVTNDSCTDDVMDVIALWDGEWHILPTYHCS